jgi:hypothetical protein
LNKVDDTCRKTVHTGMMARGFTVVNFYYTSVIGRQVTGEVYRKYFLSLLETPGFDIRFAVM